MPRDPVSDRDLARLLDEQIVAMQSVLTALEAEQQALRKRDGDALLQAVNGKATSLANANTLEARRQDLLEQLGLTDRPGRGARQFSADAGVAQRWQQVLALTRQCQAINESNGQMIRGQQRRVSETLQLLHGRSTAATEYGPAGEQRYRSHSRTLASF